MPDAIDVVIPYTDGRLAGTLHVAAAPVVVVVHGSGPCERSTPHVARRVRDLLDQGLSVLVYDKPGCGASQGDWTSQTFQDRAAETCAVAEFLRSHPLVQGQPVALVGQSQGGWVSLIAGAQDPNIAAVVTTSGPGVSVADQEIYRVGHDRERLGLSTAEAAEAVAFLQRRVDDIAAGHGVEEIFEREQPYAEATWRAAVGEVSMKELAFEIGVYPYDPAADIRSLRMPLLGVFGGADLVIPVRQSIGRYLDNMVNADPRSRLLVVPGADHGLQLVATGEAPPGLWSQIAAWLVGVNGAD